MATPLSDSKQVATALMDLLLKHHVKIPRKKIMAYMNAAGLALTALPDSYLKALDDEIVKMLRHPFLKEVRLILIFSFSSRKGMPWVAFTKKKKPC